MELFGGPLHVACERSGFAQKRKTQKESVASFDWPVILSSGVKKMKLVESASFNC